MLLTYSLMSHTLPYFYVYYLSIQILLFLTVQPSARHADSTSHHTISVLDGRHWR